MNVPVEKLLPEFSIKTFTLAVFPGATWSNKGGSDPLLSQPGIKGCFNEFWPIIRAQVFRDSTTLSHHCLQEGQDLAGWKEKSHKKAQAFSGKFIQQHQNP